LLIFDENRSLMRITPIGVLAYLPLSKRESEGSPIVNSCANSYCLYIIKTLYICKKNSSMYHEHFLCLTHIDLAHIEFNIV